MQCKPSAAPKSNSHWAKYVPSTQERSRLGQQRPFIPLDNAKAETGTSAGALDH
ncbi:hypothetical protein M434DRAFT_392083 [Hypoxylon sp. CO27-5]|nr:hypothetical protein M434DRAFT_392083 [Hypoxylon sp. CO27-5]